MLHLLLHYEGVYTTPCGINDGNFIFPLETGVTTAFIQKLAGFHITGFGIGVYPGVNILLSNSSKGSSLPPRQKLNPIGRPSFT